MHEYSKNDEKGCVEKKEKKRKKGRNVYEVLRNRAEISSPIIIER